MLDSLSRSDPRFGAVIVNWNRRNYLRALLTDLHAQETQLDEILVVDNGSSDGSQEMVASEYPWVRQERLKQNRGFVEARNIGASLIQSEFVLFLDNDIRILDSQFVCKVRHSVRVHPEAGIISFWLFENQPVQTLPRHAEKALSLSQLAEFASAGRPPVQLEAYYGRYFCGGACVMRRDIFPVVGPLCGEFRYGFEEMDFAYRCHRAGIGLLVDPALWVIHLRAPEMRVGGAAFVGLRNNLVAHARYMPSLDFSLFLLASFLSHTAVAVGSSQARNFVRMWLDFVGTWRNKISGKRRPVSRQTMRRWYYLALHRDSDWRAVERAGSSAMRFYAHHLWNVIRNSHEPGFGIVSNSALGEERPLQEERFQGRSTAQ